jgi:hypothetical protein
MLSGYELNFLHACHEVVTRGQELLPALAASLGMAPEEVFYSWAMLPYGKWTGRIQGTEWIYFFHGLECDLRHSDGRFLRIDFGPGGRFDTFTGWGVLQFIMTSKSPFREFVALRKYLAGKPPPFTEYSGSHDRMVTIEDRLLNLGYIEPADPALCTLKEKHTTKDDEGYLLISIPGDYGNPKKKEYYDVLVCNRLTLTEAGKKLVTRQDSPE